MSSLPGVILFFFLLIIIIIIINVRIRADKTSKYHHELGDPCSIEGPDEALITKCLSGSAHLANVSNLSIGVKNEFELIIFLVFRYVYKRKSPT